SNTSDGEKYLVSIKNTDRSFNQMSLHMWVDIPASTFESWQSTTTFRVEILLSAECPPNTDKDVCATAASDCLEISGLDTLPQSLVRGVFDREPPGVAVNMLRSALGGSTYSSDKKCRLCPVGTYSELNEPCQPCEPGSISFEPGTAKCSPCRAGEYVNSSGASACNLCDPGYVQPETGQRECHPCSAGYFAGSPGLAECSICAAETYSDHSGAQKCLECPENTNNNQRINWGGGTYADFLPNSSAQCVPKPGYYGEAGQVAASCPDGGVCCSCVDDAFVDLQDGLDRLGNIDGFNYDKYCICQSGAMPYPYPRHGYTRSEAEGYEDVMIACTLEV
ncbi:hypothetical protein CYMTET_20412, partial [Cymbomonas tetramitiformis]